MNDQTRTDVLHELRIKFSDLINEEGNKLRERYPLSSASTFAENRTSDEIVVYPNPQSFKTDSSKITDAAYAAREFVEGGKHETAAIKAEVMLLRQIDAVGKKRDLTALIQSWK
jgi:hypothetical protein